MRTDETTYETTNGRRTMVAAKSISIVHTTLLLYNRNSKNSSDAFSCQNRSDCVFYVRESTRSQSCLSINANRARNVVRIKRDAFQASFRHFDTAAVSSLDGGRPRPVIPSIVNRHPPHPLDTGHLTFPRWTIIGISAVRQTSIKIRSVFRDLAAGPRSASVLPVRAGRDWQANRSP